MQCTYNLHRQSVFTKVCVLLQTMHLIIVADYSNDRNRVMFDSCKKKQKLGSLKYVVKLLTFAGR